MLPLTISAQDGLISQYDYFDKKIASINLTTYYILKNGEFAYNKSYSNGYPYGAIKRLDSFEEGALSSLYICFCVSNIDSNYLCYYFDSNKWNYEVKIISGEGARNHGLLNLTPSDFFNIRIFKPHTLEEQCKISNFLELIYAKEKIINRKINILKKYKEGFTKRLAKALNTDEIALSSICSITTGKMDANAMNQQGKYKFFTCSREDYFIDTYAFDCEALLISGNGEVGLTKYYNGKFNAYQRTYVLYNLKRNAKFIKLFIDLQINTIIRKETNKGAMPYIRLTTFNKITIPNIDPSLEYLISIAIDKIDKKIELLQNHARVLNNIKNNLLSSLFI